MPRTISWLPDCVRCSSAARAIPWLVGTSPRRSDRRQARCSGACSKAWPQASRALPCWRRSKPLVAPGKTTACCAGSTPPVGPRATACSSPTCSPPAPNARRRGRTCTSGCAVRTTWPSCSRGSRPRASPAWRGCPRSSPMATKDWPPRRCSRAVRCASSHRAARAMRHCSGAAPCSAPHASGRGGRCGSARWPCGRSAARASQASDRLRTGCWQDWPNRR